MLRRILIAQACLAFLAAAFAAAPARAQTTCDVCGRPLGADAVTVTDWETNRAYRYHDLSCAVQAMQTRFPWSQVAACSPQFGQSITLSRINGTWRAQPEDALVVALTGGPRCGDLVAFMNADELQAYRKAHPEAIAQGAHPFALADLPAQVRAAPAPPATAATTPTPPLPSPSAQTPTAPATQAVRPPAPAKPAAGKPSLLGYSGLLAAPDARVLGRNTGAAVVGLANREVLGAIGVGVDDDTEVAMTSRGIEEQMQDGMGTTHTTALYASAKRRLENFSRPGLDVAAGITGLGKRSSLYIVGTKATRLGAHALDLTAGIGTGGVLDGLFAGVRAPLGNRLLPFAKSTDLLVESVNAGAGRSLNLGLDLALPRGLDVKLGAMDGKPALGVGLGRSF